MKTYKKRRSKAHSNRRKTRYNKKHKGGGLLDTIKNLFKKKSSRAPYSQSSHPSTYRRTHPSTYRRTHYRSAPRPPHYPSGTHSTRHYNRAAR
jgi:hypothetical protein